MGVGAALIATTAVSVGAKYIAARQEQRAYEYNADIMQGQMSNVEAARKVQEMRNQANRDQMLAEQTVAVASSGIEMTGSPLEVMSADLAKAEFDIAIDNYNFEQEKTRIYNEANMMRYQGKQTARAGLLNAIGSGVGGMTAAYKYRGATSSTPTEAPLGKMGGK